MKTYTNTETSTSTKTMTDTKKIVESFVQQKKFQAFLDAASVALASHPHFEAEGKAGGNPVPAHSFR